MQLNFSGHNTSAIKEMTPEELRRRFREDTGFFHHNGRWYEQDTVVMVTFNPMIYVNQDLQGQARADAMAHEERHLSDFQPRVQRLHGDLTATIAQGSYSTDYMRDRWSWFLYDLCMDSNIFHQEIGTTVRFCRIPGSPRP